MLVFAYMAELRLTHSWRHADATAGRVEPALFPLLAAIERHGSLQQAARELKLSYRHAWGLITASTHILDTALVKLERGRGATLTALGKELLRLDRKAERQLATHFARIERELAAAAQEHADRQPTTLLLHASHDLALEYLRDLAQLSQRVRLELHFKGSLESLESLARGACNIAGFHVAAQIKTDLARQYRKWLKPESVRLIHLFDRQQGLVVAHDNPKHIRNLRDLTRSGIRFVNRQQGSGTRLLFDSLLAVERVPPQRILGYQSEEFTHGAVAAMVASGIADAGFAIKAVAQQHKLDFVPLAREHYLLAARADAMSQPAIAGLTRLLRGRKFKAYVARLAGYDAAHCGQPTALEQVLHG